MTTDERTETNRCAVVTGASGKLGSKIAEFLLSRGWHVELWSRRENDETKCLTKNHPDTAQWREVDVTDHTTVTNAVRAIPKNTRLELLVNNAGALHQGLFAMETPATSE